MARYSFDEASIRRIARSVLYTERMLRGGEGDATSGEAPNSQWRPFRNDYAGTIPRYGLVSLTGITIPGQQIDIETGDRTGVTWRPLFGVNGPEEVPQNGYGLVATFGTMWVAYDSGTPAYGEVYGFKPSQFTASAGFHGLRVKGIVDATDKIMVAELYPILQFYGKATAAISANAMATGNKYQIFKGVDSTQADGGWTTVPDAFNRGVAIANNDPVWLAYAGDALFIGKIC